MNTLNVTFKSIRVYNDVNGDIRYRVTFNENFSAYTKADGEYIKAEVDYIDFRPKVLIAQLLANVDNLHIVYTKKQEAALRGNSASGFGAAEIGAILTKAKLVLERTEFVAGEEYTNADGEIVTHEHDGYNTNIIEVKVSDNVSTILQQAAMNLLLG